MPHPPIRKSPRANRVRLIPMDCAAILAAVDRPGELESILGAAVGEYGGTIGETADQTAALYERCPRNPPWTGYVTIDRENNRVIGVCGFTAAPTNETVEIAYFTFPLFEGRGFATAAANELVTIARESSEVRTVIAHTLPESNASTRVLGKNGFCLAGEVVHPEDGRVWRWELGLTNGTVE